MAHWNQPYPHANAAPPASEATTLNLTLTLSTLSPDKAQRLTVAIRLVAQQVEAVHSLARAWFLKEPGDGTPWTVSCGGIPRTTLSLYSVRGLFD